MATTCALGFPWGCARGESVGESAKNDLNATESTWADQSMQICSAVNGSGVGLLAEYFAADQCEGKPVLSRVEGPVEWDPTELWSDDGPASARWRGWVRPPLSGKYMFHAAHPGARIVVARRPFITRDESSMEPISMEAGRYYPIVLEVYALRASTAPIQLEWTAPHGMRFLIPRSLLYLPT